MPRFSPCLPRSRPSASKHCFTAMFSGTFSRCPTWYVGSAVHGVCAICLCLCSCIYKWEMGVGASYVAVVIVVVDVYASLIPVNGLHGLNRQGGVCVSQVQHSFTSFVSPGKRRGSGVQFWHSINALGTSVFTFPLSPHSLSIYSLSFGSLSLSSLDINVKRVIALAIILCFHLLLDITLAEAMLLWMLCFTTLHWWTTTASLSPSSTSWHRYARTNFFYFTSDKSSFNAVDSAERKCCMLSGTEGSPTHTQALFKRNHI